MTSGFGKLFRVQTVAERLAQLDVRSDVAAAAAAMAASRRSDITALEIGKMLPEAELVVAMIEGRHHKRRGVLLLTTRRLAFVEYEAPNRVAVALDLALLSEQGVTPNGTRLDVTDGATVLDIDQTLGRSASIFADKVRHQLTEPDQPPPKDPMQALAEARALHDAGVMSDAEFAVEKARLLDRL